jgi:hypothetical protein
VCSSDLPIPIALNNNDVIYRFPMNFGNTHTSSSDYDISVPGLPAVSYEQTRNTTVDGWGTLTTPYGTFQVLRTKSVIESRDIIAGITIPRIRRTEYKWIAKSEKIPILQMNTTTVIGIETVNEILFKDLKMDVVVNNLTGTLCPGSQLTVAYTKFGTYNPSAFLQAGNQFRVQLSNASGSFASPVQIGSANSTTSGNINVTIPANTPAGTGYKIRIVATQPGVTGQEFGPFTINPTPTAAITAGGPTTVCTGQTVSLEANSGPFQYQWNLNGVDIGGATTQNYTATATGSYTVSVSNVCGTVNSSAVSVTIRPDPVFTIIPSDTATCDGSFIDVSASFVSGVSPFNFQWFENGAAISGATATELNVVQTGDYSLQITDNIGCSYTTSALTLTIDSFDIPVVTTSGGAILINGYAFICPGESVLLSTDNIAGYFYQWQVNGIDIAGAESNVYAASVGGDYTVLVGDSCDSELSDIVKVYVLALPAHTVEPSALISCDASPITFTTNNISAASPVLYQWYANGQPILGETNSELEATIGATYNLQVEDVFGCTFVSDAFDVEFFTASTPPIFSSGNNTFCQGDSVILFTDANSNYTYQWYLDSVAVSGATSFTNYFSASGNCYVIVTYGGECEASSNVETIVALAPPTAPQVAQSNDTLFASAANSYQWYADGSPIFGASLDYLVPTETGTYTVEITDANGCTSNASATINGPISALSATTTNFNVTCNAASNGHIAVSATGGTTPYTYTWSNGQTSDTAMNLSPGFYLVTITDANGCQTFQSGFITEPTALVGGIQNASNVSCNGANDGSASINFSGGTAPYTIQWSDNQISSQANSLSPGMYSVTVTDFNGCILIDSIEITEPSPLQANISESNDASCFGSADGSARVLVSGGTAPYSYAWSDGQGNDEANNLVAGQYGVVVTDANGCSVNLNVTIDEPVIIDTAVTVMDQTLTASLDSASYQWYDCESGLEIPGATSQSYTATANGRYSVMITFEGCSAMSECYDITTVGREELYGDASRLNVFPNPNNGRFFIASDVDGTFNLVNGMGQIIQTVRVTSNNNFEIDLGHVATGVYYLIGADSDNRNVTKKIIVTKQ